MQESWVLLLFLRGISDDRCIISISVVPSNPLNLEKQIKLLLVISGFLRHGSLLAERTLPFIMDPNSSVDIDTERDLLKAEALIGSGQEGQ